MDLGKYGFFIYRKRPLWYTNYSKLDPDDLVKVIFIRLMEIDFERGIQ